MSNVITNYLVNVVNKTIETDTDYIEKFAKTLPKTKFYTFREASLGQKGQLGESLYNIVTTQLSKLSREARNGLLIPFMDNVVNYKLHRNRFVVGYVDTNNLCNMPKKCPGCINDKNNSKGDMTWNYEKMERILKKLSYLTKMYFISGGEPLLNPNLLQFIKNHPELLFIVYTNGCSSNAYDEIIKNNIKNIALFFSIDGYETYHDDKRGFGTYKQALNELKKCRQNDIFCGISTVVDKTNTSDVLSKMFINEMVKYDPNLIFYLKSSFHIDDHFMRDYNALSYDLYKQHFDVPLFNFPFMERFLTTNGCVAGDLIFHVDVEGKITTCPFLFNNGGNIEETKVYSLRRNLKKTANNCAYRQYFNN